MSARPSAGACAQPGRMTHWLAAHGPGCRPSRGSPRLYPTTYLYVPIQRGHYLSTYLDFKILTRQTQCLILDLLMIAVGVAGVIFSAIVHGRYEPSKDLLACPSGMSLERWRKYGQCVPIQAAATVGMWFFLIVTFVAVTTLFGASIRF